MSDVEVCAVKKPPNASAGTHRAFVCSDLVNGHVIRPCRTVECHIRRGHAIVATPIVEPGIWTASDYSLVSPQVEHSTGCLHLQTDSYPYYRLLLQERGL